MAVSTQGASPTLARRLRERIETVLPSSIGPFADYLASRRERIKAALPETRARKKFWDNVLDSDLADIVAGGDLERADASLAASLTSPNVVGSVVGIVSLVGAGPGDPDLLTLKALHRLQRADVVYHDKLVGSEILDRCRRDAPKIDVGRRAGDEGDTAARQAYINDQLEAAAREGMRVVRLMGGDPSVFGRGARRSRRSSNAEYRSRWSRV